MPSNPNLQKIIKLTQNQYDILSNGGTVGDYTGLNDNYLYLIQDNTEYLPTTGGDVTGDLVLYTASGDSPRLTFQRGILSDNYNDWSIYDSGGYFYLQQRGNGSSGWETRATFTQNGVVFAGDISENGTLLSNKYLGKLSKAADSDLLDGNDSTYYLNYNNLTNKPTIPTKTSDLINDRFVRYDTTSQGLNDTQKSNARTNIGAGTSNFTGYTSSNKLSTDYINNVAGWSSFSGYTASNKLSTSYIQNDAGWTSNTGTVTSVQVQAGTGLTSSTSTAQSSTLNTTISIASGYKLPTTTEWDAVNIAITDLR